MPKKKVLFILHLPPPVHGQSVVGKYIHDSILVNEKFDASYINLSTSARIEDVGKNGFGKYITLLGIMFKVIRALISCKYDLVYMTPAVRMPAFYKDYVIILLLKLFRKRIIFHLHNKGISECSDSAANRFIYRSAFSGVRVILLSKLLYPDVSSVVDLEAVAICPNGIPSLTGVERDRIGRDGCKLLFFSNMVAEKGVYVLLEACRLLHERGYRFTCDFVGAWADVGPREFEEAARSVGITDLVTAHGKKYGDDKIAFFVDADIFVFPTYYYNEAFSLVNLEAMQFGLPVVSTRVGGIPDAVTNGETGFLTEPRDSVDLADKLGKLITDHSLRLGMGAKGRQKFTREFTLEIFERNFAGILEQAMN